MTPVLWLTLNEETLARGHWDQTLLADLFARCRFDQHECGCGEHYDPYGGIVVVAGQHHATADRIERVAKIVGEMEWALTIVTSDEEALFPLEALPHGPKHAVWNQYRVRDGSDRLVPIGYPPGLRDWLGRYARTTGRQHEAATPIFFAGQETHSRRHELIREMGAIPGAVAIPSPTFLGGLDQQEYWRTMLASQVLPAPSGLVSVDSFRLYEALEMGRIPVVETHSPYEDQSEFWPALFGADHPLVVVDKWMSLRGMLWRWPDYALMLSAWWAEQKRALARDLASTCERLAG